MKRYSFPRPPSFSSYTTILIRNSVISKEQLVHAEQVANNQGISASDALVNLSYATGEQVMRALAQTYGVFA